MAKRKRTRSNGPPEKAFGLARVSTQEQGIDGLGIRAQNATIRAKAEELGLELIEIFKEVESGTKPERPQLIAALDAAAKCDPPGVVIVSALTRLTRNFDVMSYIMRRTERDGTKLVACDIPEMSDPNQTQFIWRIMAAVAELEVKRIQAHTKDRLNVAKTDLQEKGYYDTRPKKDKPSRRITRLGNPNVEKASPLGGEAMKRNTRAFALRTYPIIERLQKKGIMGLRALARELNNRNGLHGEGRAVLTYQAQRQREKLEDIREEDLPQWSAEQVKRVIAQAKKKK